MRSLADDEMQKTTCRNEEVDQCQYQCFCPCVYPTLTATCYLRSHPSYSDCSHRFLASARNHRDCRMRSDAYIDDHCSHKMHRQIHSHKHIPAGCMVPQGKSECRRPLCERR